MIYKIVVKMNEWPDYRATILAFGTRNGAIQQARALAHGLSHKETATVDVSTVFGRFVAGYGTFADIPAEESAEAQENWADANL